MGTVEDLPASSCQVVVARGRWQSNVKLGGGEGNMANDNNAAAEVVLHEDAPVMLVDGKPVPLGAIQLVDGVFVDEAGRPAAMVKPQTWY